MPIMDLESMKIIKTYPTNQKEMSLSAFSDFLDWGVDDIEAEQVFGGYEDATDATGEYTGSGIRIAILDSGIDKTNGIYHDDFVNKIVAEYDFYYDDDDAEDNGFGHGTHCAGIAGARDDDDGIIGVAPECEFLIARVMNDNKQMTTGPKIVQAINWAVSNGADIISMSWGGWDEEYFEGIHDALTNACINGVILIAAAGNDDREVAYPAAFAEVISVGAISQNHLRAGNPDAGWDPGKASCYGNKLDFVAPGTAIYSDWLNNGYYNISGTSMAAPHVAGLCALILDAQPSLSIWQVKDVLRLTATDLGLEGQDDEYGFGEVHAVKAIDAAELYFTDSDDDDLTDAHEKYYYCTDRFDPDTDNDNLNDGEEVFVYLTDPADSDTDNDGLSDGQEVNYYETSPHDPDSDNDCMPDGWEVVNGLNPLSASDKTGDLDGEGLVNYKEYIFGTDPNDSDTDGGGLDDWSETQQGKDPLDPSDDRGGGFEP